MSIYQHFRPEEKEFIDGAASWIQQVKNSYAPKLTDFLDPRQQQIVLSLLGRDEDVNLQFYGGADTVERRRALLFPDYFSPELSDFQLSLYEISYPKKFITLEHRHVLGTLMSLGLKREKFGDILIKDDEVQFVAAEEIDTYLMANLEKVGKATITIKKRPFSHIIQVDENWVEHYLTVSSLRLDTVLATALNLSRQKAQALIAAGKVKLNFKQTEKISEDCQVGDVISVRGFGRCKIISIDGKTKKDKWKVLIGKKK
ncbi:RNA-binding protein [Bacillus sp. JJ634]